MVLWDYCLKKIDYVKYYVFKERILVFIYEYYGLERGFNLLIEYKDI